MVSCQGYRVFEGIFSRNRLAYLNVSGLLLRRVGAKSPTRVNGQNPWVIRLRRSHFLHNNIDDHMSLSSE